MAYTPEEQAVLQRWRGQHHGGLSWDVIRVSSARQGYERLRATPDRRLFEAMTPEQTEAFLLIGKAHGILNAGMGVRAQHLAMAGRVSGLGDVEYGGLLLAHYRAWKEFCGLRRLVAMMAEDVIIFGLSLNESAKERRKRKEAVRANLFGCLDAWWELR